MNAKTRKQFMVEYLKLKVEEQDWHGVADAAMDLREIEVELQFTKELEPVFYKTHSDLGDA